MFEEFMASFDDSTKAGKTFVRGSDTVNPVASGELTWFCLWYSTYIDPFVRLKRPFTIMM